MKAIVYTQTGDPSVLHLVERLVPAVGPGEARVKVIVSGVSWRARKPHRPALASPTSRIRPVNPSPTPSLYTSRP